VQTWQIQYGFYAKAQYRQGRYDYYEAYFYSMPPPGHMYYDLSLSNIQGKNRSKHKYSGDQNKLSAGTWRYKVLDQ
jgi:hypothetical protein